MQVIAIPRLHCYRCGWTWRPRGVRIRICPRCKSPRWDTAPAPLVDRSRESRSLGMLEPYRRRIQALAERHGATNVRIFGSFARNEATPKSDVDLLVDFRTGHRWERVDLARELEELLGRKVDIGTPGSLHWLIRSRALAEASRL